VGVVLLQPAHGPGLALFAQSSACGLLCHAHTAHVEVELLAARCCDHFLLLHGVGQLPAVDCACLCIMQPSGFSGNHYVVASVLGMHCCHTSPLLTTGCGEYMCMSRQHCSYLHSHV
jgi:hypothetical protein